MVELYSHQKDAVEKLRSGSILCGGVGTGKSRTSLAYYDKVGHGRRLYVITTARKRDTKDWEAEMAPFGIIGVVDSWNNIGKYTNVEGQFFIFDEQRVVGSGSWVKSFLKIAKKNHWILLSATPGDTWADYIPVFIANGFYRNRTEFLSRHAVYNRFSKYPRVDKWIEVGRLERLRRQITVNMEFSKRTVSHKIFLNVGYNVDLYKRVLVDRWDPFEDEPVKDISKLCYLLRRVVNSDPSRLIEVLNLIDEHDRLIIFYNFNYEKELLRKLSEVTTIAEWNGEKHEPIPNCGRWAYLVQYTAGAEGWNCVETDTIIFFSRNYSYKLMTQAAGRIDRMNTSYTDLYYYSLTSTAPIDQAIARSLKHKKNFNEKAFLESNRLS